MLLYAKLIRGNITYGIAASIVDGGRNIVNIQIQLTRTDLKREADTAVNSSHRIRAALPLELAHLLR